MLMSTPVAPSTEMLSSSGDMMAISAARRARPWPLAQPVPISARPMFDMTVFTSAKSTLTMPLWVIEIADALDGLVEHFVGLAERFDEREVVPVERQELFVGNGDERVDVLGEERDAVFGACGRAAALRTGRAW